MIRIILAVIGGILSLNGLSSQDPTTKINLLIITSVIILGIIVITYLDKKGIVNKN